MRYAAALQVPGFDLFATLPVLLPAVAVLAVLVAEALSSGGSGSGAADDGSGGGGSNGGVRIRRVVDGLALGGLGLGLVSVVLLALSGQDGVIYRATVCQAATETLPQRCSYVVSPLTLTLQGLVLAGALGCLLLARDGAGARDRTAHHALLLSATTGAVAAAAARDLATLVVAVELASLPVIGLIGLRREAEGAQAAVTLLVTAVTSLGLLLLGVGLIYAAVGDLYLDSIATALSSADLAGADPSGVGLQSGDRAVQAVAALGTVLAIAGLGFKISAVPFHLWTPDTYSGAPLPVAAFLAVVSKTAGFAAIVVLLAFGVPQLRDVWAPLLGVLAVVTMTVGNVVALRQRIAVRLLAWSTVAQAGWVLLPLAAVPYTASLTTPIAASVAYLAAYAAASLLVFVVVVLVARHHVSGEDHTIQDYRGLARREPVATAALILGLVSLAGLPPGVLGLVAKLLALRPLVDGRMWLLAVIAVANVALGVVYYLRWAALAVFAQAAGEGPVTWRVRPAEGAVLGGAFALVLVLSLAPGPLAGILPGVLR